LAIKLIDYDGMFVPALAARKPEEAGHPNYQHPLRAPQQLHLSLNGYQVWADALKPLLTELLGPPANEDHAPPPTGDPSAAKKKD